MPTMKTLQAILRLIRLPLLFTAMADASVVVLLTRGFDWSALLAVWTAAAGLYIFGMAGNDCFDIQRDRAALQAGHAGRVSPLAASQLSLPLAVAVTLGGAGLALAMARLSPAINPWMTLAALALALLYNSGVKFVPPIGLVLLGAVRAANAAQGLTGGAEHSFWLVPAVIGLHVTFVSSFAYAWEAKQPLLGKRNIAILLAVCALVLADLVMTGHRHAVHFWPTSQGLWMVALAWSAFLAVMILIHRRAPRPQRGPLLILTGLSWLIILDWSFVLAAGFYRAGVIFAVLLAAVLISRRLLRAK